MKTSSIVKGRLDPHTSPYPAELNRQFGEIVIKDADLYDLKMYQDAISLYENFISENPPEFFTNMAKNRIAKIQFAF